MLRSTLKPGWSVDPQAVYSQTLATFTEQLLQSWRSGDTIEMTEAFRTLTLRTTTRSFFGIDFFNLSAEGVTTDSSGQDLIRFIELFFKRIGAFPLPVWIPIPSNRELKRLIQKRDAFFLPIIEQRRASGEDRGDILSMLIKAKDADTTGYLTDLQVCNEVSNLFAAGYEVTAHSLAFTLYLIAQHPEVEDQLAAELNRVLGQR